MALLLGATTLIVGVPPTQAGAQSADVIRGKVTSDSGAALDSAVVVVTMAPTTESFTDTTASSGVYRFDLGSGTGEYLLYVGRAGYKPFRKRISRGAGAGDIVVDVTLVADVQKLATVAVKARRPRPSRPGIDYTIGTNGMDKSVDGVAGALTPDLPGNLAAMAALVPGLSITPDGPSAFGLPSSSNASQLNGLSFPGAEIPRDAETQTRFASSPWDPSRGGAAGVLVLTTLASGSNITTRRAHATLDAPALQFSNAAARSFGRTYSNIQLSTGGTGPVVLDKYFYNYGVQASRRLSSGASLLDLDANALARAGVSSDSGRRLIRLLNDAGVPLTRGGVPSGMRTTKGSFMGRIDRVGTSRQSGVPGPLWSLDAYAQAAHSDAVDLNPAIPPASAGTSDNGILSLQGHYSAYFGDNGNYANETTSALSLTRSRGAPYLTMPGGVADVTSDFPDGSRALGALQFGGNGLLARNATSVGWELVNQTGFLLAGHESLPVKLYLQSRFDHFDQSSVGDRFGSFTFASLDALGAGVPTSYSRTLYSPSASGKKWTGAAAFGGTWLHSNLELDGGVRIDGNVFMDPPPLNHDVESLFGVRNNHLPNTVAVSPRLGFQWFYTARRGVSGSGVPNVTRLWRGGPQFRGGIGKFRDDLRVTLPADALMSTGLPGGMRRLLCVGAAAPAPDWRAYASGVANIPTECANETLSFADTARSVTLFDRSYKPLSSWRGTLGWTNSIKNTYVAIDATYALALHEPGSIDLNFAGAPRLSLGNEDDRPVYVAASSIVPATGAVTATDARVSDAFGRVVDRVSDLRARAAQLTAYAIPNLPYRVGVLTLGYTYATGRSQTYGFDATTAGDPRVDEWAPSSYLPRHQFTVQMMHMFPGFAVTAFLRASSGLPFTPRVAGDINGDGLAYNDRAYVFDPGTADANVAPGLRSLISNGSSTTRDCLRSQIGRIAAANSCTGPWSAAMNANVIFIPTIPHTNNRANVSLSLANPLAGLDRLFHGADRVHGWGTQAFVDPVLYRVRGFNPLNNRFLYQINPRFGRSDPAASGLSDPFRITVDVSVDLGPSIPDQQLALTMRMRPALKGTRAPADSIRQRYMRMQGTDGYMNIYALLLSPSFADSMALSREQMEGFQQEGALLTARADSIFGALAEYLAALPDGYDHAEALKRVKAASASVWSAVYAERGYLLRVLTPGQIRRLPHSLFEMVTDPDYHQPFYYQFQAADVSELSISLRRPIHSTATDRRSARARSALC